MVKSLAESLDLFFARSGNWQIRLSREWNSLMGSLSVRMRLEKIGIDGTVFVGVHDARWMQELYYLSRELVMTLNQGLGYPHVQRIQFVLARTKRRSATKQIIVTQAAVRKKPEGTVTTKQQAVLDRIDDHDLQEALRTLILLSRR